MQWRRLTQLFLLSSCFLQCSPPREHSNSAIPPESTLSTRVIYGRDHRKEIFTLSDLKARQLAESVAVMIPKKLLNTLPTGFTRIQAQTLGKSLSLCPTERFREQMAPGFCTAFLVGEDRVLTAGHCIRDQTECDQTQMIFNYQATWRGLAVDSVPSLNVYACKSVVYREENRGGADFAILRLDRRMKDPKPLALTRATTPSVGIPIFTIASTSGLPLKWIDGARIRANLGDVGFANLDTGSGSSGAPIFNAQSWEVEGILVRGEYDYQWRGLCQESHLCGDEDCRGESFTAISKVLPHL